MNRDLVKGGVGSEGEDMWVKERGLIIQSGPGRQTHWGLEGPSGSRHRWLISGHWGCKVQKQGRARCW